MSRVRSEKVHKRRPLSGGGLSSADIFWTREEKSSSDSDVRTFWRKKLPDFSKVMVCPHEQEGLSQCGHFSDKGGAGVSFSRFCADVFYGRSFMSYDFI